MRSNESIFERITIVHFSLNIFGGPLLRPHRGMTGGILSWRLTGAPAVGYIGARPGGSLGLRDGSSWRDAGTESVGYIGSSF